MNIWLLASSWTNDALVEWQTRLSSRNEVTIHILPSFHWLKKSRRREVVAVNIPLRFLPLSSLLDCHWHYSMVKGAFNGIIVNWCYCWVRQEKPFQVELWRCFHSGNMKSSIKELKCANYNITRNKKTWTASHGSLPFLYSKD